MMIFVETEFGNLINLSQIAEVEWEEYSLNGYTGDTWWRYADIEKGDERAKRLTKTLIRAIIDVVNSGKDHAVITFDEVKARARIEEEVGESLAEES